MTTTAVYDQRRGLLHPRLIGAGATLLIAALVTDVIYWRTAIMQWSNFSIWLITGGLLLAGLAGLGLLVDAARRRLGPISWWRFAVLAVAALLSLLNAFIHSRDAYTSVVPQGLALSIVVTVLLLVAGWRGWSLAAVDSATEARP